MFNNRRNIVFVVFLSLISFPFTLFADDESADGIEEVVVTARKREESLLDIPESVSAISGGAIDRQNIKGLDKIGLAIPNLNLAMRTDGYPNVSIRGIGAFGLTQGVGFYLDDVQLFSDASSRFGDLDRIEVLKGPQGTLYGGSNIGGAIKFVSKRPSADETSGRVKVLGGDQGVIDLEASLNMPVGDGWAMRVFAFSREDDGFMTNPNSDNIDNQDPDVGAYDESGGRISLAGPLSDNLSMYASFRFNEYDGPVNNWARELGTPPNMTYPKTLDAGLNSSHDRETTGAKIELVWEMEGFDLTSITSYTDTESTRITDVDLTQFWFMNTYRPEEMEVTTQEIRFTSTTDSNFQWIGGVYLSNYVNKMDSYLHFGPGIILPDADFELPFELRDEENTHRAAFGNVSYEVDTWRYDFGLRVDKWEEDEDNLDSATNGAIHSGVVNDTEVLPRLSITKSLEDSIVYFTSSKGYEPGGLNGSTPILSPTGAPTLLAFQAEEANQQEIGWKGTIMDGKASLSAAYFMIDYKDRAYQILTANPNGPGLIEGITNVGDTEQSGFEFDLSVKATDNLTLSLAAGWLDAEWDDGTVMPDGTDLSGLVPSNVIDNGYTLAASYYLPAPSGADVFIDLQWNHNGQGMSMPPWDAIKNPSSNVVNLQIGLVQGPWEFMLNMDNLTDEEYYTDLENFPNFVQGIVDDVPGIIIGTHGHPRIFSASLSYNF